VVWGRSPANGRVVRLNVRVAHRGGQVGVAKELLSDARIDGRVSPFMTIRALGRRLLALAARRERRRLTVSRSPWIPRPRRGNVEACPCREKEGCGGVRSTQAKPIRSTLQRRQWRTGTVEAQDRTRSGNQEALHDA
jgi:hypothetical protein